MGDLISGEDNEEESCELQKEINAIMNFAKHLLRKRCSYFPVVLANVGKRDEDPLFTLFLIIKWRKIH